jgi:D-xylose transport system ATP-binding protein
MAGMLLEMRNIAKSFGPVRALKSVHLEIEEGETHALCGENGAGKSTLMKILDGFYPYRSYQGEIRLEGELLCLRSPADAARRGIAMIYQEIAIHPNLSVAENLFLGHLPTCWGIRASRRLNADAEAALAQIGLPAAPHLPASRLSPSQQQLLMIARALVKSPRLLVLDEPTSALTLTEAETLHGILAGLKARGVTIIYISHRLDEVFLLADRITVLRDGETIRTFQRSEFQADQVIAAMIGRELENLYPKTHVAPGEEALRIEALSVPHPRVPGRSLIENISFSVRRGEIVGIAGLVGSGRSELLGAIYGAIPRLHGGLFLEGRKIAIRSPRDALANGIALLTEDRHKTGLILNAGIAENMTLASLPSVARAGVVRSGAQRQAAGAMARDLQIKMSSLNAPVKQLSGGNQQKVVLGKWLLTKPRVLLLDEPTRGIDVGAKSEIYKLIGRLAEEGAAIVMVSSELSELLEICDRFLVLARGRIVDQFAKRDASESRIMGGVTGVVGNTEI